MAGITQTGRSCDHLRRLLQPGRASERADRPASRPILPLRRDRTRRYAMRAVLGLTGRILIERTAQPSPTASTIVSQELPGSKVPRVATRRLSHDAPTKMNGCLMWGPAKRMLSVAFWVAVVAEGPVEYAQRRHLTYFRRLGIFQPCTACTTVNAKLRHRAVPQSASSSACAPTSKSAPRTVAGCSRPLRVVRS